MQLISHNHNSNITIHNITAFVEIYELKFANILNNKSRQVSLVNLTFKVNETHSISLGGLMGIPTIG